MTSIVNIATPDQKKGFAPGKVMLHNQGRLTRGSASDTVRDTTDTPRTRAQTLR